MRGEEEGERPGSVGIPLKTELVAFGIYNCRCIVSGTKAAS